MACHTFIDTNYDTVRLVMVRLNPDGTIQTIHFGGNGKQLNDLEYDIQWLYKMMEK